MVDLTQDNSHLNRKTYDNPWGTSLSTVRLLDQQPIGGISHPTSLASWEYEVHFIDENWNLPRQLMNTQYIYNN